MKAQLKQVKEWAVHKDKDIEHEDDYGLPGTLRIYVGSYLAAWAVPITTEPEELFKLEPTKVLYLIDDNETLISRKKKMPLQECMDMVELIFKEFIKKVCV